MFSLSSSTNLGVGGFLLMASYSQKNLSIILMAKQLDFIMYNDRL
jgi:hypothetical protein